MFDIIKKYFCKISKLHGCYFDKFTAFLANLNKRRIFNFRLFVSPSF